jgi:hypothetical protein
MERRKILGANREFPVVFLDTEDFRSADPLVAAINGEGLPGDVVVSDQEQDSACDILSGSGALEWKIRP